MLSPVAAASAVAATAGPRSPARAAASSYQELMAQLLPPLASCAVPVGTRKRRKKPLTMRLLPGEMSGPAAAAAASVVSAATAATPSAPAVDVEAAPSGRPEAETTAAPVVGTIAAVVGDTEAAAAVATSVAERTTAFAGAGAATRAAGRGGERGAVIASTAGSVLASDGTGEYPPRGRRAPKGRLDAVKRQETVAAECGIFRRTATAAAGAAAGWGGTRGDGMSVAAGTATRVAMAAVAGTTAARVVALTAAWGAAAAADGDRAAAGGDARGWLPGRGRNGEGTSPVGLLRLLPLSFSPWGVLFGIVVVAMFHVCLFWGASWFFHKHLFREYQQKRLSVQQLFAFTFTVCVAMLQLLLLELLHVLHPTLRRWVWHGDLVCVLLLLYLILPVSIVYNLVVRSPPSDAGAAAAVGGAAAAASSCTGAGVALGDVEQPEEAEQEKAETAAEKARRAVAGRAASGGRWNATAAASLGYAAATTQRRRRRGTGSRNGDWEALVPSGSGNSSTEATIEETAAVCTGEQQQGHHTIKKLGMTIVRLWCGRRRNCNRSVFVKERLLQQLQRQTEEEEEEAAVALERYHGGQQITRLLPAAAAAAVAAPALLENHYSAVSAPRVSEFAATAGPPPPCAPVISFPASVDVTAAASTPRAISPVAAATAATGVPAVASGAGGALSAAACLSPSCAVLNARRLSAALLARRGRELPCCLQRCRGQQQHGDMWSLEEQLVQQEVGSWSLQQSQSDRAGTSAIGLLDQENQGRGIVWSSKQEEPAKSCGGHQQETQQQALRGAHVSVKEHQSACGSSRRRERAVEEEQPLSPAALLSFRMTVAGDGLSSLQKGSGGKCGRRSHSERSRMLCLVFAICCVMLPLLWMCFYQSGRLLHLDPAAVASLSFMECLLAYVGICGVTVVSALAGFGSVNFPYRILFASFSKISQSQVEELEQRLLHTLSLIAEKKKKTQKLQQAATARKTATRCCFWLAPSSSSSCYRRDSSRRKAAAVATPQHLRAFSGSRSLAAVALQGGELQLQYQQMPQCEHQRADSSNSISLHPQQQLLEQQQVLQQQIPKGGGEESGSIAVAWTEGGLPDSSCGPNSREKRFHVGSPTAAADFAAIAIQRQQDWNRRIDENLDDDSRWHSAAAAGLLTLEHQAQGMGLQHTQPLQLEKQQQRQHLLQEHRQQSWGLSASAEEETGTPAGNSSSTFFSRLLNRGGTKSGGGCTYTPLAQRQIMSGERGEQQQQLRTGIAAAGPLEKFRSLAATAEAISRPSQRRRSGCSSSSSCKVSELTGEGNNSSIRREEVWAQAGRMKGIGSGSSNSFSSSEDEARRQTSTEILQEEEKNALSSMERGFACSSSSRNRDNCRRLEAVADNRSSSWGLSRRWKESTKGRWRSSSAWRDSHRRQEGMSSHDRSNRRDEEPEGTGPFEWLRSWRGFFAEGVTCPAGGGKEEATAQYRGIEPLAVAEVGVRCGAGGNAAAEDGHVGGKSCLKGGKRWKDSGSTREAVCSGGGAATGRREWLPWRVWSWACGVLQQQQQGQQWLWTGVGGTHSKNKEREEEGEAQQQHLQSEITALEKLSRELFVALDNLVQSRAQALYRETVVGRLHSLFAWIMTGVCIFRVGSAGFNVLCGRSSTGLGAAGAAGAAPVPQADPATRVLEVVLQQLQVPVNVAAVSPYLSLMLLSCIIALTIRNFVEKLLTVFRHVSTSSVWTANVLALVMAEIMGFYFSACVLLTRVYLPQAYQDAVTQVLAPSLDFRVFHLHFDRVFLVSCLVSFAAILFSHRHVTEKLKSL